MAILPEIPGLELRVKIEGELARDYENKDTKSDEGKSGYPSGHFYVEAKTGAKYCVQVDVTEECFSYLASQHPKATCLQADIYIDGEYRGGRGIQDCQRNPTRLTFDLAYQRTTSKTEWEYSEFVFDAVKTNDADESATCPEAMKMLGQFEVLIWIGSSSVVLSTVGSSAFRQPQELHVTEKDLKKLDVTHRTTLSTKSTTMRQGTFKILQPECIGSLTFAYRSREMLQDLLVIPQPEVERETPHPTTMSHEELLAFATRHWSASQNLIKEEASIDSRPEVKNEKRNGGYGNGVAANRKRKRVEVDLTED